MSHDDHTFAVGDRHFCVKIYHFLYFCVKIYHFLYFCVKICHFFAHCHGHCHGQSLYFCHFDYFGLGDGYKNSFRGSDFFEQEDGGGHRTQNDFCIRLSPLHSTRTMRFLFTLFFCGGAPTPCTSPVGQLGPIGQLMPLKYNCL